MYTKKRRAMPAFMCRAEYTNNIACIAVAPRIDMWSPAPPHRSFILPSPPSKFTRTTTQLLLENQLETRAWPKENSLGDIFEGIGVRSLQYPSFQAVTLRLALAPVVYHFPCPAGKPGRPNCCLICDCSASGFVPTWVLARARGEVHGLI